MNDIRTEVLVVGAGLSGSVVARIVAEKGYRVRIIDRRSHVGGNMYDHYDEYGVLVHDYGPHTFHTNKTELYDFMCRFSKWVQYSLKCGAEILGVTTPTPFNFQTIDDFFPEEKGKAIKAAMQELYPGKKTVTVVEALNSKDNNVKDYAQFLFDHDYKLYTAKQWGVSPEEIDASVLARVPLRIGYEDGYFEDQYQLMPETSYTDFFDCLLDHPNIQLELGVDARDILSISEDGRRVCTGDRHDILVVYTGALDELFSEQFGRLPYRSLRFEWVHEAIESKQKMAVVAYPEAKGYTRIVEFKKMTGQKINGTTYEIEYPLSYDRNSKQEPYYPVLTTDSKITYKKYAQLANQVDNLIICGRLADYQYYNMDQALERAMEAASDVVAHLEEKEK